MIVYSILLFTTGKVSISTRRMRNAITSLTASADGTLYSEIRYSAYGEVRYDNGTTPTKFQYTGQLSQMDEIGLYYYVARFYDPVIAHFTQADTIVPNQYNTASWDRFQYVVSNPIRFNDPSGHYEFEETPEDNFFLPAVSGIMPARRSTSPKDYTSDERRQLINKKANVLQDESKDSLMLFSELVDYSITLYNLGMREKVDTKNVLIR